MAFRKKLGKMSQAEKDEEILTARDEENAEGLILLLIVILFFTCVGCFLFSGSNVEPGGRFYFG
jgi:hypothetical protein